MATQTATKKLIICGLTVTTLVFHYIASLASPVDSDGPRIHLAKGGNLGHKVWPQHEECMTPQLHRPTNDNAETCSARQPIVQKGEHHGHE
jgi:hypothetical protein